MTGGDGRILGLPRGAALRGNLLLACVFAAYFCTVYWTGNFVAVHAAHRFHVALPFETLIPFVPSTAAVYLTITPLLWLAPFIFRTPKRLLPLFVMLSTEVTIAGIAFCLFPVELSFPARNIAGIAGTLMGLTRAIVLEYNCVPSLHVALALTAAWAYQGVGEWHWRAFIWSWAAAITASTLLAHQHHLADLAAGAALSAVTVRYVPPRVQEWLRIRSEGALRRSSGGARGAQESVGGVT
jgi:hypothetical protein